MPGTFTFGNGLFDVLFPTQLSPGNEDGIVNDPSQFSALTPVNSQFIDDPGNVDVLAISLLAGQQYTFDIDDGAGDSDPVDTAISLIQINGIKAAGSDDGGVVDPGSLSRLDPLLTFTPDRTGLYVFAVHQFENKYTSFNFSGAGTDTGDYRLVVSTPDLPPLQTLGGAGNIITFNALAQRVAAGDGNDVLDLQAGNDSADGQLGDDTLHGRAGDDQLAGSGGADRLTGGTGDDALLGGDDDDVLLGADGDDDISGGNGDDRIGGGSGNDRLWGDDGRDVLNGQDGNDFIRGWAGVDLMNGGGGADVFHFLPGDANDDPGGFDEDLIADFGSNDTIDLSDVFPGRLTFLGTGDFTGAPGEVRIEDFRHPLSGSGFQEVQVNMDADTSTIELAILADTDGNFRLGAGDFVL